VDNQQIQMMPEELFMLIGEREVIKYKQAQQIGTLLKQVDEMGKEIEKLREELKHGK